MFLHVMCPGIERFEGLSVVCRFQQTQSGKDRSLLLPLWGQCLFCCGTRTTFLSCHTSLLIVLSPFSQSRSISPIFQARTATWVRSARCNFERILLTYPRTVFSLRTSCSAMAVFVCPSASNWSTSSSREVSSASELCSCWASSLHRCPAYNEHRRGRSRKCFGLAALKRGKSQREGERITCVIRL